MRHFLSTIHALGSCLTRSILAAALAFGALASVPAHAGRAPPPDPEQGDGRVSAFYTWEKDIPAKPGVLLRSEVLPDQLALANAGKQFRILYTSTDGIKGSGTVVVSGAVFLPKGPTPKGGWPVIAWAHGTVGVADICAPSWNGRSYRDTIYLNRWLKEGYAIVATDYQGLGVPGPHPQINIPAISWSTLDSIRAVIGFQDIANNAVVVGQSQGGAAAFGSAVYAPTYSPDINLKGVVGTGVIYNKGAKQAAPLTPAQLYAVDDAIVYSLFSFIVAKQTDPLLDQSDLFTEKGAVLARLARTSCLPAMELDLQTNGFSRAETYRAEPSERYKKFLEGAQERALKYSVYPTLKTPVPIFIGTGASDLTPAATAQLELMRDACAAGSTVEGHLYAGLTHSATVNASLRDSVPFVKKLFAGEKIRPVCQPILQ